MIPADDGLIDTATVASELLLNGEYIIVPIPLANLLGLERAVLLKSIHEWCVSNAKRQSKSHYKNGYYWTYGSYEEWATRLPFLGSARSLQRLFLSLEKDNLLISNVLATFKGDRRKWYRVDRQKLGLLYLSQSLSQTQSIVPKTDGGDTLPPSEYKCIVPKTNDGDTQSGTTIMPKTDGGRAKSGRSSTKTKFNDSIQGINSLSDSEREPFFEFGRKKAAQLPHPPELPDKWITAHWEELYRQFQASNAGKAAKQEAIAIQYDWINDPRFEEWLPRAFEEGVAWAQENQAEREQRSAFLEWAQATDPYKGRLY